MESSVQAAMAICRKAHEGQTDKAGRPYYLHPFAVADKVRTDDEKAVAFLHDVLEDTDETPETLRAAGIPDRIVASVEVMTRRKGQDYFDYLERLKRDPVARAVKLADLAHNTDPSRPGATPEMLAKYEKARRFLAK